MLARPRRCGAIAHHSGVRGRTVRFRARATVSARPERENGASTGTCTPLSTLPRSHIAFYVLPAWSRREDSHLRSPEGQRVYGASQLLLCHTWMKLGARAGLAPATFSL